MWQVPGVMQALKVAPVQLPLWQVLVSAQRSVLVVQATPSLAVGLLQVPFALSQVPAA